MRSKGFRRGTRNLLSKDFRDHGKPSISRILQQFRVGDLVDCKIDPSIVKGMPHKYYHGKTGVVYNANPSSYGVIFHRRVGGKYIERIMNIRVEHLRKSRSDEDTKRRYAEYTVKVQEAREKGLKIAAVKRQPVASRPAFIINKKGNEPIEVSNKKYNPLY